MFHCHHFFFPWVILGRSICLGKKPEDMRETLGGTLTWGLPPWRPHPLSSAKGHIPDSAPSWLCDLEQVTHPSGYLLPHLWSECITLGHRYLTWDAQVGFKRVQDSLELYVKFSGQKSCALFLQRVQFSLNSQIGSGTPAPQNEESLPWVMSVQPQLSRSFSYQLQSLIRCGLTVKPMRCEFLGPHESREMLRVF